MTKRENYTALRAIVADNAELVAFIDHEIELLNKKNARRSDKPTAKQVANEDTKGIIGEVLTDAAEPMTISDIVADDPALRRLFLIIVNAPKTVFAHGCAIGLYTIIIIRCRTHNIK